MTDRQKTCKCGNAVGDLEILNDLSKVRDGIMEKVRECSKE